MTKYIGPKTDGENVATQADKLSLSSETPDALTPDQTGAAGTATTAARSDHQHEILAGAAGTITPDAASAEGSSNSFARADHTHAIVAAAAGTIQPDDAAAEGSSTSFARADHTHAIVAASAGTITGTNAEGSSTSFARADHNHAYGNGSIPQAALALGPTYETSLPGSPVDGQEIYYAADAANGVIWHLRYRSAARSNNGAWEYLGGPPLWDNSDANITGISTTTRTAFSPAVSITTPAVSGDYDCKWGAQMYGLNSVAILDLVVDGSTPTFPTSDSMLFASGGAGISGQKTRRSTSVGVSKVIEVRYRVDANSDGQFRTPWLMVRPVRVW